MSLFFEEDEVREKILSYLTPLDTEQVPLSVALGRYLSEDLRALISFPRFDQSAMDGYALGSAGKSGDRFELTGIQPAGVAHEKNSLVGNATALQAHEAWEIYTGAPIPPGAVAVIMKEDVTRHQDHIILNDSAELGEWIRKEGEEVTEGQLLMRSGSLLDAKMIALAASQGYQKLKVRKKPRFAVITTGDELVDVGEKMALKGQIYNSNRWLLESLVKEAGAEVAWFDHFPDDLEKTLSGIEWAWEETDWVVSSGGVSVGERDFIKPALEKFGATLDVWKIQIKPGKPFLMAVKHQDETKSSTASGRDSNRGLRPKIWFGLPGNPVSSWMTFWLFVQPAIRKLLGIEEAWPSNLAINAKLKHAYSNLGDRVHYVRGLYQDGYFEGFDRQDSHRLKGLADANAILRMEAGQKLEADAVIQIYLLK